MAQPVLGILTLYLNDQGRLEERPVYQRMIEAGHRMGMDVFVFTPQDVDSKNQRVKGLFYNPVTKKWARKRSPFPHLIYDRCRIQRSHRFEQLRRFRNRYSHLRFLNRPMRHKWTVYRTLAREARFRAHLPYTKLVESSNDLDEMLRRYPLLYMKPINGTGGRGILRIERLGRSTTAGRSGQRLRSSGLWTIQGRDHARRIIRPERLSYSALRSRLMSWQQSGTSYLIQQGIQLKLPSGRVHDYRMLVQKNGSGQWELTGCAGRIGAAGSITSNLHGGGQAASMRSLLVKWIGNEAQAIRVEQEAAELGLQIAEFLDFSYGHLCELALDLAIDQSGHIWLLEVNPKPSREVFARAGEHETYRNAIIRPLEYALWLYRQKTRR